jgi:mannose-6-phosphate isomerase
MPQQSVNRILQPLIDRILPLYQEKRLDRSSENFWAARATLTFSHQQNIDRGIFSVYFFNLVQLKKGEGIFQDAGIPHAYLEGQNVEIMANSDNVLRGGLTNKYIDVKELLRHVIFEASNVEILHSEPGNNKEKVYKTTAPDFQLSVLELTPGPMTPLMPITAEILLLIEGKARITSGDETIELKPGIPSAIVFPGQILRLETPDKATLFRASVPSGRRG